MTEPTTDGAQPGHPTLPDSLTLSVECEERLLERAREQPRPTELLVAPVELHRRNVQRRLREANAPKDAFTFDDPVGASRRVLAAVGASPSTIDRVDRLALVGSLLAAPSDGTTATLSLPTAITSRDPRHVEQIRAEVETITNFHPARVAAWRRTAAELAAPFDAESCEPLDAALGVERALRDRAAAAVSEAELVRRATRTILETDGEAWTSAYPAIERVSVLGLSSVSATDADLLAALLAATSVDVEIHCRRGTGDYLERRLGALIDVADPGAEVFE